MCRVGLVPPLSLGPASRWGKPHPTTTRCLARGTLTKRQVRRDYRFCPSKLIRRSRTRRLRETTGQLHVRRWSRLEFRLQAGPDRAAAQDFVDVEGRTVSTRVNAELRTAAPRKPGVPRRSCNDNLAYVRLPWVVPLVSLSLGRSRVILDMDIGPGRRP